MTELSKRQRRTLLVLLALALLAVLLLSFGFGSPRSLWVTPLSLQLAGNGTDFKAALLSDWLLTPLAGLAPDAVPSFARLRGNLFVDSMLLVPAYVGLLLFFTLAFGPPLAQRPVRRQLLCVPAVAAGLFDIAENGMTGRALDDLIHFALADATAADVSGAARIKWVLLGIALAVLAWRVAADAAAGPPGRRLAAGLCGLAAVALVVGGVGAIQAAIEAGFLATGAGLGLLAVLCLWLPLTARPPPENAASPPPRPSPPAGPPAA